MKSYNRRVLLATIGVMVVTACVQHRDEPDCGIEWQYQVDETVATGDGMGHGPDVGSDEWQSVVEFRLGVRGSADVPERGSPEWCTYIQNLIEQQ